MVAAGAQTRHGAGRVAAEAVGHQPLAPGAFLEHPADTAAERDAQTRHHTSKSTELVANGSGRQIKSATRPVQPV